MTWPLMYEAAGELAQLARLLLRLETAVRERTDRSPGG
jgi:hypothetical protein